MKEHRTQPTFRLQHRLLYSAILISLGLLSTTSLLANPKGGAIVGGQGKITQTPGITTIDQTSRRAIINWKDFSIGKGELTRFNQPGKNAIALNRVLGKDPSNILGQLQANGHVWLVNPNGILIGPDAQVDVQGLLATTADIADQDFLSGRYHFSIPSPNPDASVVNQGLITIGQHGFGGLVAPHVRNSGVITGRLGQVVIAGAPTFTLDYYGDGLIQFAATSQVTERSDPSRALVENDGTISVDGGDILITANAAASVVEEVINTSGIIEARSFAVEDGMIVLMGGDEGIVNVAGSLDASGAEPDAAGGTVDVLGDKLLIADSAHINTSGPAGGGQVHVGGDLRGEGDRQTASQTIVMAGAEITADATEAGDGGQVVVWSDERTAFAGSISSKGGKSGGNGGFVETSSIETLTVTGQVDTNSPEGENGSWLLDPLDIQIISPEEADSGGFDITPPNIFQDDSPISGTSYVVDTLINSFEGTVILEARRNITVKAGADVFTFNDIELFANQDVLFKSGSNFLTAGVLSINARNITTESFNFISAGKLVMNSLATSKSTPGIVDIRTSIDKLEIGKVSDTNLPFSDVHITQSDGGFAVDSSREDGLGIEAGNVTLETLGTLQVIDPINSSGEVSLFVNDGILSDGDDGDYNLIGDIFLQSGISAENDVFIASEGHVTSSSKGSIIAGGIIKIIAETDITPFNGTVDLGGLVSASGCCIGDSNNAISIESNRNFTNKNTISATKGDILIDIFGSITINGSIKAPKSTGSINLLICCSSITQAEDAPLEANKLFVTARDNTHHAKLNAPNRISNITVRGFFDDTVEFTNNESLTISEFRNSTGTVKLSVSGDLNLQGPIIASGSETSILINTSSFTNNLGGDGLDPDSGRYLVYSQDPINDFRNIPSDQFNKRYNFPFNSSDPDGSTTDPALPSSGNFFLYEIAPTLTLNANDKNRFYGDSNPELDFTPSGLIDNDTLEDALFESPELTTFADQNRDSGIYPILIGPSTIESPLGYKIEFVNGNLTIDPAELHMVLNGATRGYGDPNDTIEFDTTFDSDGFKLGQGKSDLGPFEFVTDAREDSDVADNPYDITITGFENGNYQFDEGSTTNGDLILTPASLFMVLNGATREYGEQNDTIEFDATFEGFKLDQVEADLGIFEFETDVVPDTPVAGNLYDINVTGFENDNYYIDEGSTTGGKLFFITPAPLSAMVDNALREYGDQNTGLFDASFNGFKLGQDKSVLGEISFDSANEAAPVAGSPYPITVTDFENTNYVLDSEGITDGELTITPAPLTAITDNAIREYGDQNTGLFDASFNGFKLGQDKSVLGEISFDSVNEAAPVAGSPYPITVTGFENTNYEVDRENSTDGDLTITPAPLTITANDQKRKFGKDDPEFTVTYGVFKLNEDESVVNGLNVASDAKPESLPGNYTISPSNASADNYLIQHINGTLKVSAGDKPDNPIPQTDPTVPVYVPGPPDPSSPLPTIYEEIYSTPGIEYFTQQADQQLNPEVNKLLNPKLNQQGDQQDDLLFSNDGNHELWGR